MKAVLTLVFVLISGVTALANTGKPVNEFNLNIESLNQVTTVQTDSGTVIAIEYSEVEVANEKSVARLYKFKNSRIKKALAFTTKRNKAKKA